MYTCIHVYMYTYNFEVYIGSEKTHSGHGLGYDVVVLHITKLRVPYLFGELLYQSFVAKRYPYK